MVKPCKYCGGLFTAKNSQVFCCAHCAIWSKIDKRGDDECWPWLGNKDTYGYGQLIFMRKRYLAHRFIAKEAHGDFGDLCALHSCDNPQCCNPSHLRPGTPKDNGEDKAKRGRGKSNDHHGEMHPQARLSISDVIEIRAIAAITPRKEIAQRYGLSKNHVCDIIGGRRWSSIPIQPCDNKSTTL